MGGKPETMRVALSRHDDMSPMPSSARTVGCSNIPVTASSRLSARRGMQSMQPSWRSGDWSYLFVWYLLRGRRIARGRTTSLRVSAELRCPGHGGRLLGGAKLGRGIHGRAGRGRRHPHRPRGASVARSVATATPLVGPGCRLAAGLSSPAGLRRGCRNRPSQSTSFLGRGKDIADITAMLDRARLVTLHRYRWRRQDLSTGCSTLSTEGPLEECVDTAESGGVAILD